MTSERSTRPVKEVFDAWWEENKETCNPLRMPLQGALMKAFLDGYMSGADSELERILELAGEETLPEKDRYFDGFTVADIRAARRAPIPTLKSQALSELNNLVNWDRRFDQFNEDSVQALNTVRKALESIPE